jgi:hypothetical protein
MKRLTASVLVMVLCLLWTEKALPQRVPEELKGKYEEERLKKLREGGKIEDIYDASFDYPELKYLTGQLTALLALTGGSFLSGAGWFLGGLGVTGAGIAEFGSAGGGKGYIAFAGAWMVMVGAAFVIVGFWGYSEVERVSDQLVDEINKRILQKLMQSKT